jgi:hypothetical protein
MKVMTLVETEKNLLVRFETDIMLIDDVDDDLTGLRVLTYCEAGQLDQPDPSSEF